MARSPLVAFRCDPALLAAAREALGLDDDAADSAIVRAAMAKVAGEDPAKFIRRVGRPPADRDKAAA